MLTLPVPGLKGTIQKGVERLKSFVDSLEVQSTRLSGTTRRLIRSLDGDFRKNYFIGGDAKMFVFDKKCVFENPYGRFDGVEAYRKDSEKLGRLMKDVQVEVTEWQEEGDTVIAVWQLNCRLNGPLKPSFSTTGQTTFVRSEV